MLRGRGVTEPSFGEFNGADREFLGVRLPAVDPVTGRWRYPGQLGFRVEHYLSCAGDPEADEYDRMTTEILIAGRRHGCFDAVVGALTTVLDAVEREFVVAEFDQLLSGRDSPVIAPPKREIDALVTGIRRLYDARHDAAELRAGCTTAHALSGRCHRVRPIEHPRVR